LLLVVISEKKNFNGKFKLELTIGYHVRFVMKICKNIICVALFN